MARVARAALTLAKQVDEHRKRVSWTTVGEPDGLDVHRVIRFNRTTGKWLEPLLDLMQDERIESWESTPDGLLVTFVATTKADYRDLFPLDDALAVAGST